MLGGIRTYTYAYHAPWAVATTKLVVCYDNTLRVVAVIPSTSVDMPFTR